MRRIIFFILTFVLLSQFVGAIVIDEFNVKIEINQDGTAKVNNNLIFNSKNHSLVYIPIAQNPESIEIKDSDKNLKYTILTGFLLFKPEKHIEEYHVNLNYITNSLTSKIENWEIEFTLPSPDVLDWNKTNAAITFSLPKKAGLISFNSKPEISADSDKVKVKWNILLDKETTLKTKYKLKINTSKNYVFYGSFVILLSILIILGIKYLKDKFKRVSKGKKNIIKVLNEKERKILDIILSEKKEIYQSTIRKKSSISKATLSRTLKTLERRKIIEIKSSGNTNIILLTEWFNKL